VFVVIAAIAVVGCSPSAQEELADTGETGGEEMEQPSGEMISFASGDETVSGYLAAPSGEPRAIVVVVQEWWGLNDWIKSVADRFAARGYLAIAPDLYRGHVATEAEEAHELARGLPEDRAVGDLLAATAYARSQAGAEGLRVGVVGFCMGGRLSLVSSLDDGPFEATVVCYGRPVTDTERLRTLRGPVLGIYGADDKGIGPEQVEALEKGLDEAGKQYQIYMLENAGHAFMNSDRANSYAPEASEIAWGHIDVFLEETLGEAAP
jgi:carboxymethylenebutenolidase